MTKGFTPEENHYELHFEPGHALHGLQVTMASLSVGEYNQMMRRSIIRGLTEEALKANDDTEQLFVDKLVSWNLTDRAGKPVPRTREGIQGQDRKYIGQIVTAWQMAMLGIDEILGKGLSNGELSQEESLGLES
jgi:hypothetical protein